MIRPTVDDFVAVKALDFNRIQQHSTSSLQQVQQQSITNHESQSISTGPGIWFGTRGSEVQILSPRPIIFKHLCRQPKPQSRSPGFDPDFSECNSLRSRINTALPLFSTRCKAVYKIDHSPVMEKPGALPIANH